MAQILNFVYVIGAVVLLFGAAVFVHEFGHFWVARRRGLKVEAFAIGFGPKIISWVRDGIEYSWRWIPAGGFVRLPQMSTSDTLEGGATNTGEPIPPASPWSKIQVAFAGPLMNALFAVVIATAIYFLGLPELVNPPIVGYVEPGSAEAEMGIREGDRVVSVYGKPVKTWQDVQAHTMLALTNVLPVVIERDGATHTYQLTATFNQQIGLKLLNLEPRDHPEIIEVLKGGAAESAGLKDQDVVLAFAGVPIVSREQLIDLIQKRADQTSEIRVQRAGEKLTLQVTPRLDPVTKTGRIGVSLNRSANVFQVQRPGPTPWQQIVKVWRQTIDTLSALIHSKQTGVGAKDLSGPVGILSMLAVQVNTDYRLALSFLVLLNINLAVLNLLPIPVLDGGHIMLAIVESIRRRPLRGRIVEYANATFAVLLISFMLYVTFFDVKRWSLFRAMFKQSTQIEQTTGTNVAPPPAPAPQP